MLLAGPKVTRLTHLLVTSLPVFLSLSTPAVLKTRAASRDTPRKIKERQHVLIPVFADAHGHPVSFRSLGPVGCPGLRVDGSPCEFVPILQTHH